MASNGLACTCSCGERDLDLGHNPPSARTAGARRALEGHAHVRDDAALRVSMFEARLRLPDKPSIEDFVETLSVGEREQIGHGRRSTRRRMHEQILALGSCRHRSAFTRLGSMLPSCRARSRATAEMASSAARSARQTPLGRVHRAGARCAATVACSPTAARRRGRSVSTAIGSRADR